MLLTIDTEALIPRALVDALQSDEAAELLLDKVAASARVNWLKQARDNLGSSLADYTRGIQDVSEDGPGERSIALTGWLPNAVEQGLAAFDLRSTVLAGPRVKMGAGGSRYQNIPFRHAGPDSGGKAGKPMGRAYGASGEHSRGLGDVMGDDDARQLGHDVYDSARRLVGKERLGRPSVEGAPFLAPHHKSDIYAGMRRIRKPYVNTETGKTTVQTQYMTWRTISSNVESGWLHPGIESRHLADQVSEYLQGQAPIIAGAMLKGAVGERP